MSDQPRYARVLYTSTNADGHAEVIAVHADLAYFPNAMVKPASNAADDVMTAFFNKHLADNRTAEAGRYAISATRRTTADGIPFFDVRLTGLGASAVRNEYGVKPYRSYPIYITYTPAKDAGGTLYAHLNPNLQAALAASGLKPA